ncbi:MAG: hypothetical protein H0X13_17845 [Ramlibacter sp.]|nr:hypothetical protein [Ramlibacter sp.]
MSKMSPDSAGSSDSHCRTMRRPRSISPQEIGEYLELTRSVAPALVGNPDVGLMLVGSLSEGFGNSSSDADILAISEDAPDASVHRQHWLVNGRRVELWRRSVSMQVSIAAEVSALRDGGSLRTPSDLLHDYQQYCNGTILQDSEVLTSIAPHFNSNFIQRILERRSKSIAKQQFDRAVVHAQLGSPDCVQGYLRLCGVHAAKLLAIRHGETYVKDKCVVLQLERAGLDPKFVRDVELLLRSTFSGSEQWGATERLLNAAGISIPALSEVRTGAVAYLTDRVRQFDVQGRLHLICESRVFLLSASAASSLRGTGILEAPSLIKDIASTAASSSVILNLHRLGIVGIRTRADDDGWEMKAPVQIGEMGPFFMSPVGAEPAAWPASGIVALPIDARSFAIAGAESSWARVVLDHCDEDLRGASPLQQWPLAEHALRRWSTALIQGALASAGHVPLPTIEETYSALNLLESSAPALTEGIKRLAQSPVVSAETCVQAWNLAKRLTAELPLSNLLGDLSFTHENILHRDIERDIGSSWIQLAAELGAKTTIINGAVFPPADGTRRMTHFAGGSRP